MSTSNSKPMNLYSWIIQNGRKDILDAWDFSKNEIQPEAIPFDSETEVYWKDAEGNSTLASVASKTKAQD